MKNLSGQSLSEYVIIGALVVVLAIPALMLIGEGLNGSLSSTSTRLTGDPYEALAGNGSASDDTTGSRQISERVTSEPRINPNGVISGGGWQARYDASTGQIIYAMPASGGGGTNTTSVSGLTGSSDMTSSMADALKALSESPSTDIFQFTDKLRGLISSLAEAGHNIAEAEALLIDDYAQAGKELDKDGFQQIQDLGNADYQFNTAYRNLANYFSENPGNSELRQQIDAYSGMISELSYSNLNAWSNAAYSRDSVGTAPQVVPPLEVSAPVTHESSESIGTATN